MPTLAVPLRDMVMEQVDADRLVLSGGVGDNGDNVDIHIFTRSTRGEAKMICSNTYTNAVQDDTSFCSLGLVGIKTKVVF